MLKQMISWEGFDGKPATKTCYFNLTRYEIAHDMELEVLEHRFKRFSEDVIGDKPRDMSPPEIREMLDIFKVLVKHSYGVRSEDGKRFTKNEEIWEEFVDTGAFDAFIWFMFQDADRANEFMNGIWPKEIQEAAAKIREERPNVRLVETVKDDMGLTVESQVATDDHIPSISTPESEVEGGWHYLSFTREQLLSMSDDDWRKVMRDSTDGRNVPLPVLQIDGQRKSGSATE